VPASARHARASGAEETPRRLTAILGRVEGEFVALCPEADLLGRGRSAAAALEDLIRRLGRRPQQVFPVGPADL